MVVSAPSGAGKSSIWRGVLAELDDARYSVSVTTRTRRPDEVDGQHYHFVDRPEFMRRVEAGRFVEWAEVHGHLYGTDSGIVREALRGARAVLLDIDVQGGAQLKAAIPEAVSVFVLPPSWDELRRRLLGRGDESAEAVRLRLRNARDELGHLGSYDYIVLNDDLARATRSVVEIIRSEGCRESRIQVDGLDAPADRALTGG